MKKIISIVAIALMVCGCSKQETVFDSNTEMNFISHYPTRATATAFEQGDKIGIYVIQYDGETPASLQLSGNYANNSVGEMNNGVWSATPKIYWGAGKFDVYAYYPYAAVSSVDELPFSVALDQSVEESGETLSGYESSDFLWAKTTGVSQSASVALAFQHKMSKLAINLVKGDDYEGDIPTDAVVVVHNTVPNATIDLATGTVTKNGYETAQSITARKITDTQYAAIVVPQRIETKRPLVEVIAKGVSYLVESSFVFKAGTQHTLNITLSSNPEKVKIEIGGEIEGGWN